MIFAEIPYKIRNPIQMSTKTTREQVVSEILGRRNLFQVGCGSGSMSLDFLLNGGATATLLDHDLPTCEVAAKNALHNKLHVDIYHPSVKYFNETSNKTFDAIIVSTAFLTPADTIALIEKCLEPNGIIITILKEDVINLNSMANMKETIRRCQTTVLDPIVNPEDDIIRLIYKGIKRSNKIKL